MRAATHGETLRQGKVCGNLAPRITPIPILRSSLALYSCLGGTSIKHNRLAAIWSQLIGTGERGSRQMDVTLLILQFSNRGFR